MLQSSARTVDATTASAPAVATAKVGYQRWVVCALLFFAATINYIDRQVIGLLKPTLQTQFGWSEIDYADIVFAFQLAYAIGLLMAGKLMDRLGARTGFALAIVVWSLAAMAHAEAEAFGSSVSPAAKRNREDLREVPLVTIDGEDARDFDDAVWCEEVRGGWRVLVAIADVSSYVAPGSALDREAQHHALHPGNDR